MSSVNTLDPTPPIIALWGIDSSGYVPTVKLPSTWRLRLTDASSFIDKSNTESLPISEPINTFPPKDKSFAMNNLFFIVTSSSIKALAPAWISSVNTLEPTPPIIALWGIELSVKFATNAPPTCKSPVTDASSFTDKSYVVNLLVAEPINTFPPKDKSFAINNLFFIVTSSSTNALAPPWISSVNTLEPTPPIIALWGIDSSVKVATNAPPTCKSPVIDASSFTDKSNTVILLFVPPIIKFPAIDKSFATNNLLLKVISSSTKARFVVLKSVVKLELSSLASNADWGIEPSAKLAYKFPLTWRSPFTDASSFIDKSNTVTLPVAEPIKTFPPNERSFVINKRLFIVTSSSTNNLFVVVISSTNWLPAAPPKPITASWGMEFSGKFADKVPFILKSSAIIAPVTVKGVEIVVVAFPVPFIITLFDKVTSWFANNLSFNVKSFSIKTLLNDASPFTNNLLSTFTSASVKLVSDNPIPPLIAVWGITPVP